MRIEYKNEMKNNIEKYKNKGFWFFQSSDEKNISLSTAA